jgi:hypothetical protein
MRFPLLLVEWEDAFNGDHDWIEPEGFSDEQLIVRTVGFEVRRNAAQLTLAMSHYRFGNSERICDLFTIPTGMIRRETVLRKGAPG